MALANACAPSERLSGVPHGAPHILRGYGFLSRLHRGEIVLTLRDAALHERHPIRQQVILLGEGAREIPEGCAVLRERRDQIPFRRARRQAVPFRHARERLGIRRNGHEGILEELPLLEPPAVLFRERFVLRPGDRHEADRPGLEEAVARQAVRRLRLRVGLRIAGELRQRRDGLIADLEREILADRERPGVVAEQDDGIFLKVVDPHAAGFDHIAIAIDDPLRDRVDDRALGIVGLPDVEDQGLPDPLAPRRLAAHCHGASGAALSTSPSVYGPCTLPSPSVTVKLPFSRTALIVTPPSPLICTASPYSMGGLLKPA